MTPTAANETEPAEINEEDIDTVLKRIGPYGRFQVMLQIAIILAVLGSVYNFMLSVFTADDPPWKCTRKNNSSEFCVRHGNRSILSNSDLFDERCKLNRDEWEFTTPREHSLVTEFELVCAKSSSAAFTSSTTYMGGILGSIVSGIIADTYGRKPVIILSLISTICFSVGCSFVQNIWQFSGINTILGASVVACYYTAIVLLSELVSPNYRIVLCNIALITSTPSFLIMDLMAYLERNWRPLTRYLTVIPAFALICSLFLPESPRWLLAVGRKSDAETVFQRINKVNGKIRKDISLKSTSILKDKQYTYFDLCRNAKVIVLTLCVSSLWVANPIVVYSIALESSNLGGDMYQAFALSSLVDILSASTCAYLCDRFGRKKTILSGLFIGGILVGLNAAIPQSIRHRYIINITVLTLARLFNGLANFGLYNWTIEVFPTVLRTQGMAVCTVFERLGLMAVPFIITLLRKLSYNSPFILVSILAIVGALIGVKIPETKKQPTREKFEDFFQMKTDRTMDTNGFDNCSAQNTENDN